MLLDGLLFFFFEKSEENFSLFRRKKLKISLFISLLLSLPSPPLLFPSLSAERRDARMRHRRFLLMLLARSTVPSPSVSVSKAAGTTAARSSSSVSTTAATTTSTTPLLHRLSASLVPRLATLRLSSGLTLPRGGPRASPGRCTLLRDAEERANKAQERERRSCIDG